MNGKNIKYYELIQNNEVIIPNLPLYIRIDGRSFHVFTKGFQKPFDLDFMKIMQKTTSELIKETKACIGYTQSDEISLAFYPKDNNEIFLFGGRKFKLISVFSSLATSIFIKECLKSKNKLIKERTKKINVSFDCRIYQLPNIQELFNVFKWREDDAVKNSINMLAQSLYKHKELQNKNQTELQDMIYDKGLNWNNCIPDFKRGTFFVKVFKKRKVKKEYLNKFKIKNKFYFRAKIEKLNLEENNGITIEKFNEFYKNLDY